jgi:hypothetical protein
MTRSFLVAPRRWLIAILAWARAVAVGLCRRQRGGRSLREEIRIRATASIGVARMSQYLANHAAFEEYCRLMAVTAEVHRGTVDMDAKKEAPMSSVRREQPTATNGATAVQHEWNGIPARIFLQPVAAPSVLGLFGFAGATFMVAANLAGWYGSTTSSPMFLFPFAAILGGIAQFTAGVWGYRARDALATAMHGTWGSFWIAYGLFWWLVANHTITPPSGSTFVPLGYWFIVLAAITLSGAIASLTENLALFSVLGTLTAGSVLLAISYLIGSSTVLTWGGWVLVVSAVLAWYTATAMMLTATTGRTVLPLFKPMRGVNKPGARPLVPVEYAEGEPGVKMGQ